MGIRPSEEGAEAFPASDRTQRCAVSQVPMAGPFLAIGGTSDPAFIDQLGVSSSTDNSPSVLERSIVAVRETGHGLLCRVAAAFAIFFLHFCREGGLTWR
jgi:hypothetical protein